jgi:hypothetical protein
MSPNAALAALSELVDRLGRSPTLPRTGPETEGPFTGTLSGPAAPRPLRAVASFQATWSRLRVEHRLREALAQVPAAAGPLNTSHLVNRTLQAMHDLSPHYLDAFMSHIDTLQRLEQASGGGSAPAPALKPRGATKPRPPTGRT